MVAPLTYALKVIDRTLPKISGGNVKSSAKDVDPEPLNKDGIVLQFSENARPSTITLKPGGGKIIGTEARWGKTGP